MSGENLEISKNGPNIGRAGDDHAVHDGACIAHCCMVGDHGIDDRQAQPCSSDGRILAVSLVQQPY